MANFQPQDFQPQDNSQRYNKGNRNSNRKRSQWKRQPLKDIDGNITMGGLDAAAPMPATNFNNQMNPAQQGQGRRRNNRNRNRNQNRNGSGFQNGQAGQTTQTGHNGQQGIAPSNGYAKSHPRANGRYAKGQTHAHPQATHNAHQNSWGAPNTQTYGMQVAPATMEWTSPQIMHVHMNGVLTPVDNHGDVVMGEAPSLNTVQLAEQMAGHSMAEISTAMDMIMC